MATSTARAKGDVFSTATRTAPPREGNVNCVVAKGTKIEGKFKSSESVRMDGTLVGDVHCEKKLVLGESGKVEGQIDSRDAVIMGHVVGELKVNGILHLVNTAFIEGNIIAKKIIVDEGARYSGECKIG